MRGTAIAVRPLTRAIRPSQRVLEQVRYATTALRMPAMSPTMTEGGITGWKKQEGETFAAGDVLLEVETDKATIDVEAQDDGVMGKIIVEAGSSKIPVGQVIAMLAEEGDDLASIEVPKDLGPEGEASSSASSEPAPEAKKEESQPKQRDQEQKQKQQSGEGSTGQQAAKVESSGSSSSNSSGHHAHKQISHPKPLFPSVIRLLQESDLSSEQISKLKGTGKYGMLTKGDVLVALGKLKNPYGSAEKLVKDQLGPSGKRASEAATSSATAPVAKKEAPLDGPSLRRLIISGMSKATQPPKPIVPHVETSLPLSADAEFDSILSPYSSLLPPRQPAVAIPGKEALAAMESRGSTSAKKDEWAGLF